ncbi:hypothetical protein V8E52_008314 [Russula decolorans]
MTTLTPDTGNVGAILGRHFDYFRLSKRRKMMSGKINPSSPFSHWYLSSIGGSETSDSLYALRFWKVRESLDPTAADDWTEKEWGQTRTHARIITWQKYFGSGAPRRIADGAESTPRRTALVSHHIRISYTCTEVLGKAGMWGMGKSESFLWFYTVQSRSIQAEGGMPVMVAPTPYSDWLSLSAQSSHGVLVRFLPNLMGRETEEGGKGGRS